MIINKRSHFFLAMAVGLILMAGMIALSGCTAASPKQDGSVSHDISSSWNSSVSDTSEQADTPSTEKSDDVSIIEPSEAAPILTDLSGILPNRENMKLSVCGAADENHVLLLYVSDNGRSFAVDRLNTNNGETEVVTKNTVLYRPRSTSTAHRFDFADADTVVDKTDGVIYLKRWPNL